MLCTTAIDTSKTIRTQTGAAELKKVSLPTIAVRLVGAVPAVGISITSTLSGNTARVIALELRHGTLRHVHSAYTATITSAAAVADGPARRDASCSLPVSVQNCDTLTLFKSRLKAHLFSSVYAS